MTGGSENRPFSLEPLFLLEIDRQVFGVAEIKDHPHPGAAKVLCHLCFRAIFEFGGPSAFGPFRTLPSG